MRDEAAPAKTARAKQLSQHPASVVSAASVQDAKVFFAGNTPISERFNDVYFAREDGLTESREVFLAGNDLPQRWQAIRDYRLVETGFGTGLNCLATWFAWRNQQPSDGTLHYLSIERFPLREPDLAAALSHWPELAELAAQLLCAYPSRVPGCHRLDFPADRFQLSSYSLCRRLG